MKKTLLSLLCASIAFATYAQDETVQKLKGESSKTIAKDATDTTKKTWRKGGLLGINIAQGSLTNWAAGGDDFSLSANLFLNGFAFYQKGKHSWDNNLDINLGYVKTTSLGGRKNDDRFDLLSKYGYAIGKKTNIASLFNFRSQFFAGYTYASDGSATLTSNLLAPAYVLLSLGIDHKPSPWFSVFVSPLTSRWIIVNDDSLAAKGAYGVPIGKKSVNELGAYATINFNKKLNNIVSYKGRLDLFSNYKHDPQNIDIYMTNLFSAKLSKVLSATWSIDFIYDDDVKLFGSAKNAPALQIKSLIGVGMLVKL